MYGVTGGVRPRRRRHRQHLTGVTDSHETTAGHPGCMAGRPGRMGGAHRRRRVRQRNRRGRHRRTRRPGRGARQSEPGTVAVRIEETGGAFIEGFEVGLPFAAADSTVLASTPWTDIVESFRVDSIEDYYDRVLEQDVPAGRSSSRREGHQRRGARTREIDA